MAWLAAHQEEINRLNVFPVPDGDTGTNMLLTLQSAVEDIRDSQSAEVGKVAKLVAHGSLMGARGNSGVILSQIFRGFATAVQGKTELTPTELADGFDEAANFAYRAVMKPTEGTILTVAREAGRSARVAASEPDASAARVIKAAVAGARAAVDRTPTQLKILQDAGVVDAGGYGLQVMLEGMLKSVEELGDDVPARPERAAAQAVLELPEGGWGYCTEFLIHGRGMDVEAIRREITDRGNSVLVVGDEELVKVHVHTDDPPAVIALASAHGQLDRLNVGDMSTQHRRIKEAGPAEAPNGSPAAPPALRGNGLGVVAVAAGDGLTDVFRSLGADAVVDGGQTMNPSTQDILAAVERVGYDEVIVLPNNKNVVPAARQVRDVTGKRLHVLETVTAPQGVAALVAFNSDRNLAENIRAMREAARHVQTIEVTHAVRDTRSNGLRVKKGDVVALINGRLEHAGHACDEVVASALAGLGAGSYELVTIYRGKEATDPESDAVVAAIRDRFPDLEVEIQAGGQEHYPFIMSVE